MRFLKKNTAVRITVGPFFDKTDGVTSETALTVTACKLTATVDADDGSGVTLVLDTNPTASGGSNDMVHITGDDAGYYDLELAAANVNYTGRFHLAITDASTHCPVFHEFTILPALVYDSLIIGSDNLQVDTTQWLGTAVATPTIAGVPEVDITHIDGTIHGSTQIRSNAVQWAGVNTATDDIALKSSLAKGTDITGFNDLSTAQVNTEVDTAIADARLDELLSADSDIDGAAPPTVGSVFHELMSKSVSSFTYDQTTDSNEAIRDKETDIETDTAEIGVAGAGLNNINLPDQVVNILGNITGNLSGSVGSVTSGVTVTANNDKTGYALSSAGIQAIWDALSSALTTVGSIGKRLVDYVTADIAALPTASEIADAVWDEDVDTTHQVSGSAGKKLDDAGAAADPWSTSLPGAYGSGTAGKIVGDNVNATISSRSSHSAADIWAVSTRTLTAFSTSLALSVWDVLESAIGTASSIGLKLKTNLDATISSRLSSAGYTAPDNARISSTETNTLNLFNLIEYSRGQHTGRGNVYYWDPVNGNDSNGGLKVNEAKLTWTGVNALVTAYNHDIVVAVPRGNGVATSIDTTINLNKAFTFLRGPGRDFEIAPTNSSNDTVTLSAPGCEASGFVAKTHTSGTKDAVKVTADFALLHNLWVDYSRGHGVAFENSSNSFIDKIIIQDAAQGGSGHAISFKSTTGNTRRNLIGNIRLLNNSGDGIRFEGANTQHNYIVAGDKGSLIAHNTGYGVNEVTGANYNHLVGPNVFIEGNTSGNVNFIGINSGTINWDQFARGIDYTSAKSAYLDATISSRSSHSVTDVWTAGTRTLTSIGIKKNTALANFEFIMIDTLDHITAKTGLVITSTRSIDGANFAPCANGVTEVGFGVYKINLAASDLNGDIITFRFISTGADDRILSIVTTI